jgi:GNAT superfamily N-acetyltransferase
MTGRDTHTSGTPVTTVGAERIVQATFTDLRRLGRVIADAFADLEQNLWLVPDPEMRPYVFPATFALQVELGLRHGVVYTTPERAAVAVWLPVAGGVPTLPDYDARLAQIVGKLIGRFRAFEATMVGHHPVFHPHHWLAFLAVIPAQQHGGIGTELMAHHHRVLDDQNLPGYLEAVNPRGRDFYRARGWRVHADPFPVAPGGPAMHPLWREPQAGAGRRP